MNKLSALIPSFLFVIILIATGAIPKQADDKIIIAFGSCSHQDKEQKLWDDIVSEKPALWIWLGDNIYGDSEDMNVLRSKYSKQKADTGYQKLLKLCPVIGTWDDHDYGMNDGGKNYKMKDASQQAMLDFLDVPKNDPRRTRKGVYTSYDLATKIAKVKVILLDTRFFRDDLVKENGKYIPQQNGTVLGEEQWKWLEGELNASDADVHIIASSIQVIPEEHDFEKWANFSNERKRLLDLITNAGTKNPVLISGDRHIGEISMIAWNNELIYEVTSSSLTHGWSSIRPEANKYRPASIVYSENYGVLEISKSANKIRMASQIKSDGKIVGSSAKIN